MGRKRKVPSSLKFKSWVDSFDEYSEDEDEVHRERPITAENVNSQSILRQDLSPNPSLPLSYDSNVGVKKPRTTPSSPGSSASERRFSAPPSSDSGSGGRPRSSEIRGRRRSSDSGSGRPRSSEIHGRRRSSDSGSGSGRFPDSGGEPSSEPPSSDSGSGGDSDEDQNGGRISDSDEDQASIGEPSSSAGSSSDREIRRQISDSDTETESAGIDHPGLDHSSGESNHWEDEEFDEEEEDDLEEENEYIKLFRIICERWQLIEINHNVSKTATNEFWEVAVKLLPTLIQTKQNLGITRKIPQFVHIRRMLNRKILPPIQHVTAYRNERTNEIHEVKDEENHNDYKSSRYTKIYETASVQVKNN